jgi:hypothetical protein
MPRTRAAIERRHKNRRRDIFLQASHGTIPCFGVHT